MNIKKSTDKEIILDRISKQKKVRFATNTCPICKDNVPASSRYPNYVCKRCSSNPVCENGRTLSFGNQGISGGFEARYSDTNEIRDSQICYIKGIKCWADEAYMGGIVIQPFSNEYRE